MFRPQSLAIFMELVTYELPEDVGALINKQETLYRRCW